jgi:hypothetical protein
MKKEVVSLDSLKALLLISPNKIDPIMQVFGNMIAFKCLSHKEDKMIRIAITIGR